MKPSPLKSVPANVYEKFDALQNALQDEFRRFPASTWGQSTIYSAAIWAIEEARKTLVFDLSFKERNAARVENLLAAGITNFFDATPPECVAIFDYVSANFDAFKDFTQGFDWDALGFPPDVKDWTGDNWKTLQNHLAARFPRTIYY
jgi:hypothetical protein